MTPAEPVLALRGVARTFGPVRALRGIDLRLRAGEIHAVLGENGAGKSTATKILAGLDQPDSGTIELDGVPVELASRSDAIEAGIGLVPQSDGLIGELSLLENLCLTRREWVGRRRRARRALTTAAKTVGMTVDLDTAVRNVTAAERQQGELVLALADGARVLLLDEPTSLLGHREIAALLASVRRLADADAGVAVLFITHRLREVLAVADTATVLTQGEVRWHGALDGVDEHTLITAMVGDLPARQRRQRRVFPADAPAALTLQEVSATTLGDRRPILEISLRIRAGEILAVTGVAGSGQRTLADTAAGVIAPSRGTRTAPGPVGYVPEHRLDAVLPGMSAKWSAAVNTLRDRRFTRFGMIRQNEVTRFARDLFARSDVRPADPQLLAGHLSGGNQQKLIVARELQGDPAAVVLHEPTQGLDPRAAHAVREQILAAARAGVGILLITADHDEVDALADRALILVEGRITEELAIEDLRRAVVSLAGGAAPTGEDAC